MNKAIVVALIVSLFAIGGGAIYYLTSQDDDQTTSTSKSSGQQNNNVQTVDAEGNPVFQPLPTTNEAFIVNLEAEQNGVNYIGTVSYDGNGNSLFEGTFENDQLKFYDINGQYISCQNDTCYSLPSGENGVNSATYEYTEDRLENWRDDATYVGKADCSAGTCDQWRVENEEIAADIFVASDGRISKATGVADTATFTATFIYQPLTIAPPENVQSFPLQ